MVNFSSQLVFCQDKNRFSSPTPGSPTLTPWKGSFRSADWIAEFTYQWQSPGVFRESHRLEANPELLDSCPWHGSATDDGIVKLHACQSYLSEQMQVGRHHHPGAEMDSRWERHL